MNKEQNTEASDNSISIAYQNKDISSKYLASMHGSTFAEVLGIDMPPLLRNEPTELPAIEVSDMMMDNLFLLTDGSYVIIDYESKYCEENKIKYLNYVARLVKTLYNRNKRFPHIHIVIIYTADVTEGATNPIKLIITPLSVAGNEAKVSVIKQCIGIIERIKEESQQKRLFGGLIAFTDKVIDFDDKIIIKERLDMTTIERMYFEEELEAIRKNSEHIALNLLKDGMPVDSVSRNTGLDIATVEELNKSIQEQKQTVTV